MAILDIKKTAFLNDKDENVFVGLKLPLRLSSGQEGYFESNSTTLLAVKENIKNLLKTKTGERLMQPNLGIGLDEYLFEPITDELLLKIETKIKDVMEFWLPFVGIKQIIVTAGEEGSDTSSLKNNINVKVTFNIQQNDTMLETVNLNL
tara:strand:- start:91 stop:537 length:447 start_codon:yes stop_codon:yes gene_type:complete